CVLLGQTAPDYGHLPLAVTAPGQKLSKQNHATDISSQPMSQSLQQALSLLGQQVPIELHGAPVTVLLSWALANWQLSKVPKTTEVLI
ncbi:MAG: tRNA glutamyl-Q(34) synthetase GluQRS, partial [Rheinheimera sp.]